MVSLISRLRRFTREVMGIERRELAYDSLESGVPTFRIGGNLSSSITQERAMRFTAAYAAIRLRSNTIASLPKSVYDLSKSGYEIAREHPVYKLLKYRPNRYQDVFSFWNFINTCLDGWGNSYVLIYRDNDATPQSLIPIHPKQVQVTTSGGKKYYKVFGTKGHDGVHTDENMMHFYNYTIDGLQGVDPISYNAEAIASGIGSQQFGNEFFETKGNIKAVLETDQAWTEKTAQTFLSNFETSKRSGNPVLTHGVKWKTINISPEAAQMLQTRTFALQDICRIFMVPPHLLGDLSRSTFSNIEHQDIEFVKHYIRPTVKMFETEMDRKLFFEDEWGKYEIKMNLDGLLRGDMAARAAYYHMMVLDGCMSRNEVREKEHLNPIEGLDKMMYPGNELMVGEKVSNNKE